MEPGKEPTAGPDGQPKEVVHHYAWNHATSARQAELERHGGVLAPVRVATGSGGGGGPSSAGAAGSPVVGSAWNSAGTWEERDVSSSALGALSAALAPAPYPEQGGKAVHLAECKLTGKATLISSRGKLRLGYECELAAKFEVREGEAVRARGSLAATLESEDGDVFDGGLRVTVEAKPEGGIPAGEATALVKLIEAPMRARVKAWEAATKGV
jgi:hypothetical protein